MGRLFSFRYFLICKRNDYPILSSGELVIPIAGLLSTIIFLQDKPDCILKFQRDGISGCIIEKI